MIKYHWNLNSCRYLLYHQVEWRHAWNCFISPDMKLFVENVYQADNKDIHVVTAPNQFVRAISRWHYSAMEYPHNGAEILEEFPCPLRWRHNDHSGVSNHQPHGCLLNRLFRRKSKKTSKLRVTGLCAGNSPGTGEFPAQMASDAENVSIWWRHHAMVPSWSNVRFWGTISVRHREFSIVTVITSKTIAPL